MHRVLLLILSIAFPANAAVAESTHPFSIRDMLAMRRISEPDVSPDGRQIAFTVRSTDLKQNKGRTDF